MIAALQERYRQSRWPERSLAVAVGIIVGLAALVLARQDFAPRYVAIVLGILCGGIVVLATRNLKAILLIVIMVDTALALDVHLTCNQAYFSTACGINISLSTIALAGLYGMWMLDRWRGKAEPRRLHAGPLVLLGFAFLWAAVLSLIGSANPNLSLYQIWVYGQTFLLFFYLANNIRTEHDLMVILFGLCLGLAIQLVVMELQLLGIVSVRYGGTYLDRIDGTLAHPNITGGYLMMATTVLLSALFLRLERWKKGVLIALIGLALQCLIVGTQSRGSWVAMLIAVAVILVISIVRRWLNWRGLAVTFVLVSVMTPLLIGPVLTRLTEDDRGAAEARGPLQAVAFNMIQNNPVVGVGVNNFGVVLSRYVEPEQFGAWLHLVHNAWLLMWAEMGTLGIAVYVLLWLATAREALRLIRRGHPTYAVLAMAVLATMAGVTFYMSVEIYVRRVLIQFVWIQLALVVAMSRMQRLAEADEPVVQPAAFTGLQRRTYP